MPNTLRQKLTAGSPTVGTHYLSADPDLPEIIGDSGLFDIVLGPDGIISDG